MAEKRTLVQTKNGGGIRPRPVAVGQAANLRAWLKHGYTILLALALANEASAGWISGVTVRNVRTMGSSGAVSFATTQPILNPSNCLSADFYGIAASDNPKQALAILLTAQVTGTTVSFYIPEGAAGCESNGRPHVTDVMIGSS